MVKSNSYIEQVKAKAEHVATKEQMLVDALSEVLNAADCKLLDDMRNLATQHETRRAMILTELQNLARRLGTFNLPEPTYESVGYEVQDRPYAPTDEELKANHELDTSTTAGDWRRALANIGGANIENVRMIRSAG